MLRNRATRPHTTVARSLAEAALAVGANDGIFCSTKLADPSPAKLQPFASPLPHITPPVVPLTDSPVMHREIGMDITTSPLLKACSVNKLRLISPPRSSRQSFVTEPPCSSNQDNSPRSSAAALLDPTAMTSPSAAAMTSALDERR